MSNAELSQLVHRIAQGDRAAFAEFYRRMEKPLFRFIRSKLNDPFHAADILHDVFLDIWRGAKTFQDRSAVKTWAFSIAYRKVMDVFRKNRRLAGEEEMPERMDEGPDAAQCLIATQEKEMVQYCLGTLSPEHRSAIELTFFEDMTYREVAEVTGIPEGTAKSRVFHAKNLLLRCLSERQKKGGRQ